MNIFPIYIDNSLVHDHPGGVKAVSFPVSKRLILHEKGTTLINFLPGQGVSLMAKIQKHLLYYY